MNILKKILVIQFFLLSLHAHSQFQQKQISLTPIDIKDGLSSYTIRKIIQDHYGFTWIATKDGLNRFDGKTFKIYNPHFPPEEKILSNDVWDMCEDTSTNLLWLISSYGGLNAINTQTGVVEFTMAESAKNFRNVWMRCLRICLGKVWIGSNDGLFIYDIQKKSLLQFEPIVFQKKQITKDISIDLISVDRFNRVWVFVRNLGVIIYSGETFKILQRFSLSDLDLSPTSYFKMFTGFAELDSSNILLATAAGFRIISYDKNKISTIVNSHFYLNQIFSSQTITACDKEKDKSICFATLGNLFNYNFETNRLEEILPVVNGTKTSIESSIWAIYFDNEDHLWLGTEREVFFSVTTQLKFVPIYQSSDYRIKIESPYFLCPVTDSSMYVCASDGLYFINNNNFFNIDKGKIYWYIGSINEKFFFVSNNSGCFVLNEEKKMIPVNLLFPELKILQHEIINSGVRIGDSVLALASQNGQGIYLWNIKKHTVRNINNNTKPFKLENTNIYGISKSSDSAVWIISDNNICFYNPEKNILRNISWIDSVNKKPYGIFKDACEANGYYWIAAYGEGILQVDKNFSILKIISSKEGLNSTGVSSLTPVDDSLIFATTNNGLFVLNVKNFDNKTYYQSDGLNSSSAWLGYKKNEIVYIGGDKGYTIIYPKNILPNIAPPKLYVNNIKIQAKSKSIDTSNLFFNSYIVPSDFLQATVSFSALNYSNPSRTTYQYRIKELNTNWISLGTQNFVTLIGFSPGDYTLEVKAANEDGVWCEPKTLSLTFLPKWYQTAWFKAAVILFIGGLFYSFYRYRINQLKKQQQIRREIAGDLHDDLGATLNSTKIFTRLAKTHPEKQEYFEQIDDSLNHAYTSLRDMIWVLDDTGDTIADLVKRIKQFGEPVANANNVRLEFSSNGNNEVELSKPEKRNLLLISKEGINNCIKYAECKNIYFNFTRTDGKITLIIEDDGCGFDEKEIIPGNGLKNIRARAKQIHYTASIESRKGEGTRIVVVKK